ncbi:MAG: Fic family protein [Rhabdochlamydiaceae bacterium]|nr:Fic family protein [Rhabdochlamydiaceae bacterium]
MAPHTQRLLPYVPEKLPVKLAPNKQLLRSAHLAMKRYNALLLQAECPKELLHFLVLQETIATTQLSTHSMHLRPYLEKLLMQSEKDPAVDTISDTFFAFDRAARKLKTHVLSKSLLCEMHAAIKRHTATVKSALGQYRSKQNWIGAKGCSLSEAYFLPPTPDGVKKGMKQLITFANCATEDPLLQLAQVIAQILIIHPFMDGNGRVARMSIPLILYTSGALASPYFFMSRYIQQHRLDYLRTLYDITDEDNWLNWTHFFLKGLKCQAEREGRKVERLLMRWGAVEEALKEISTPRLRHRIQKFLFTHPLFTPTVFQQALDCSDSKRDLLISTLHRLKVIAPYRTKKLRGWVFQPLKKLS